MQVEFSGTQFTLMLRLFCLGDNLHCLLPVLGNNDYEEKGKIVARSFDNQCTVNTYHDDSNGSSSAHSF